MERFRAVTSSDLVRVAERLLEAPRALAVVGPFGGSKVEGWLG
jgi:predicted Zn-dependent peptidase